MNKKNKTKIGILLTLIMLVTVFIVFNKKPPDKPEPVGEKESVQIEKTDSKEATLEIGNEIYKGLFIEGMTVYDFMDQLQQDKKISFKYKTYIGMGKFVEEINQIRNKDKYWLYYVNGKKAEIGISNYKIKSGDVISWKYQKDIY